MDESTGQVSGSAAEIYQEFFVPALFAEWAPRVADAVEPAGEGRSLDVACGTGVLARELARRVGAKRVVGLDCNEGMLAVARGHEPGIEWRLGRAEELPFADEQFDAVTSQFGLMFFEDRARAVAEMWRVLQPGGRLAIAVWGRLEDTPGYRSMVELLERLFDTETASELRAPFALGDSDGLRELFCCAGVLDVTIETSIGQARFPSIRAWVQTDIRGWTLADRIDDDQLERLSSSAEDTLRSFVRDGEVVFDSPAHIVTAHKQR